MAPKRNNPGPQRVKYSLDSKLLEQSIIIHFIRAITNINYTFGSQNSFFSHAKYNRIGIFLKSRR